MIMGFPTWMLGEPECDFEAARAERAEGRQAWREGQKCRRRRNLPGYQKIDDIRRVEDRVVAVYEASVDV
jgi:hypothetical protein